MFFISRGVLSLSSKMRTNKIIQVLEREGDLTGSRIKEFLDEELRWGAGSINSVVMLCRTSPRIEKKEFVAAKRLRQIRWGLK